MAAAQIRMKALVASRLMMGDIRNWVIFENERKTAGQIAKPPYRSERFIADWPWLSRAVDRDPKFHRQELPPL
jgi:hypothetical protein